MAAPRRRPRGRPGSRPAARRPRARTQAGPSSAQAAPGPRFTGRAAILVLVALVLVISYASSLRAWLQQRDDLAHAKAQIASSSASVDDLQQEKRRWDDPAFVEQQARDRFGWVLPGEVGYRVIGADGKPLGDAPRLADGPVGSTDDQQWYGRLWHSVESAAKKPETEAPAGVGPGDVIKPKRDDVSQGSGSAQ
ncbi:MAG: FtsB family cell division protein [Nocardioidaceae bacterium]